MRHRKRELMIKYKISMLDLLICACLKILFGANRSYKYIFAFSKWKYGKEDKLSRFYTEYYFRVKVGKYTYGWERFHNYSAYLESIGSFCSIAGGVRIVEGIHPGYNASYFI